MKDFDGKVAALGAKVDPERAIIAVDGLVIGGAAPATYLLLHKPAGVTSTVRDRHARRRRPESASQAGVKGPVKLLATIGKDGKVKSVEVISGHPLLRDAAADAVRQWIYTPTLLNGSPVETQTEILVDFR